MSNFKFISYNVDTSEILSDLNANPSDWDWISTLNKKTIGGDKDPYGFLPLTMGAIARAGDSIKDSELLQKTDLYNHYPSVQKFLKDYGLENHSRAAFFRLKPGGSVGTHIDDGRYYLSRDRYHLSLRGRYAYTVGSETYEIEPGTFFWFDNKLPHSALNIGNEDRISFVFDHRKNSDSL